MTCVVGLVADSGDIIFGADSLVTTENGSKFTLLDKKVFLKNNMVFGFCGDLRLGQLLKHKFNAPSPGRNKDIEAFIHTKFVPELQKFFQDCGYIKFDATDSFEFMVGLHKSIFTISQDYSVVESTRYHAIGSGADYALGVMFATNKTVKSETERLTLALDASSTFSQTVAKPFYFERLSTPKRSQTKIKK